MGDPSGVPGAGIPAGQADGGDGAQTGEAVGVSRQTLRPPDGAVGAQPRAVPHKADAGLCEAIVRHAGEHMGVVVLHLCERYV